MFVLFLIVAALILTPPVQQIIVERAAEFISDKTGTQVSVGKLFINFRGDIVLKDFYAGDLQNDSLVSLGELNADIGLIDLLKKKIRVKEININYLNANIARSENDSTFNFQFLIDAFSSNQQSEKPAEQIEGDSSKPWTVDLEKVALNNFSGSYDDRLSGYSAQWKIEQFLLRLKKLDIVNQTIAIEEVIWGGNNIDLVQNKPPENDANENNASALPEWIVQVEKLNIDRTSVDIHNAYSKERVSVQIGDLLVEQIDSELKKQTVFVGNIKLSESYTAIEIGAINPVDSLQIKDTATEEPATNDSWDIALNSLTVEDHELWYHNHSYTPGNVGFDNNHIGLSNINLQLNEAKFNRNYKGFHLAGLSLTDQNGFKINNISARAGFSDDSLFVRDFSLKTENSALTLNANATYPLPDALFSLSNEANLELEISPSQISFEELWYFAPSLAGNEQFNALKNENLQVEASLRGHAEYIDIGQLVVSVPDASSVSISGNIQHLSQNPHFDLLLDELVVYEEDVRKLLPEHIVPEAIRFPQELKATGSFKGTTREFHAGINLTAASDEASFSGYYHSPLDALPQYELSGNFSLHRAGFYFNKDEIIKDLSGYFELSGQGVKPSEMETNLTLNVAEVMLSDYCYEDLSISASFKDGSLSSGLKLRDSLANFNLDLKAKLLQPPYNLDANLELIAADLLGLGITDHDLRAKGALHLTATGDSLTEMQANLEMYNWAFFNRGNRYRLDSLMAQLITSEQETRFHIAADILNGHFNSNIPINQLDDKLQNHVNQYYEFGDTLISSGKEDGQFDFNIQLKSSKLVTQAIWPDLTGFAPVKLSGRFDEESDHLDFRIEAPEISYGDFQIDSLFFTMLSDKDVMSYALDIEEVRSGSFQLFNPKLSGSLTDQTLHVLLEIIEDNGFKNIVLNGDFTRSSGQRFGFSLRQDGIVLADKIWSVPEANEIQFGPQGILANSFEIARNGKMLSIHSTDSLPGSPLELIFKNFDLGNISQIVQGEEELLGGILSGNLTLEKPENDYLYRGNARIDNLSISNTPLGNLTANAQRAKSKIRTEVKLEGEGNNLYISGYYTLGASPSMDYKLEINRFNLDVLNEFTTDYIEDVTGFLTGSFAVSGETKRPVYQGNLVFNDAGFHVPLLGTTYKMNHEEVLVSNGGLHFREVTLLDDENHKATLDGTVETISVTNYRLSLNAEIDRFRVLRKHKKEGDLFYGDVLLNSTVAITGTTSRPVIRASASMVKGADLSLIIPENEADLETSGGIDEFADVHGKYPEILTYSPRDTSSSMIQGIDLRADIRISKETAMQLYLDEEELNFVSLRGDGDLVFGIDPSGKVTLTGRYEIDRGVYQLVYQKVIRRKFDLEKGSSIVWLGDPLQARLDLKAVHTVETSPLDLIEDQLAGAITPQQSGMRKSLPFKVRLIMTEELLTPNIRFNLDLPPEYQNAYSGQVYARLQQLNRPDAESELNKQVFSLLVLGRFLPSDPMAAASGGASATMRNSVTQVLNSQLKKVTEKYSKGFDLDLSIDSYSTTANEGRTALSLGVSKDLFDERLSVQVGGSVDIEGNQGNQKASDLIGDITVEYLITPGGIWRVRGFRKNTFEGIIDGEIVETGVALIFSRNYNHVKELFMRKNEENSGPESGIESPGNQPIKPEEHVD